MMRPFYQRIKETNDGRKLYGCHRPIVTEACRNYKEKLLHCSRCKNINYCSKECQVLHWKSAHRDVCIQKVIVTEVETTNTIVTCALCFVRLDNAETAGFSCEHKFHTSCLERLSRCYSVKTCPICSEDPPGNGIYKQAFNCMQKQQFRDAEKLYRRQLEQNPEDMTSIFALANVLFILSMKEGTFADEGERLLEKLASLNSADVQILRALGQQQITNADFHKAEKTFMKLLENRPEDASAFSSLGKIHFCLNEKEKAIEELEKAHALNKESQYIARYYYVMLKSGKKSKEARKLLQTMTSAHCNSFDADIKSLIITLHNMRPKGSGFDTLAELILGRLMLYKGFSKIFKALPPNFNMAEMSIVVYNIGVYHSQDPNKYELSTNLIKLALQNEPKFKNALQGTLFGLYLKRVRSKRKPDIELLAEGIEVGRWYIKHYPEEVDSNADLAVMIHQQADFDTSLDTETKKKNVKETEEMFKSILERDPNNQKSLHFYGLMLKHQNRLVEAQNMFERLVSLNPKNKEIAEKYLKEVRNALNTIEFEE